MLYQLSYTRPIQISYADFVLQIQLPSEQIRNQHFEIRNSYLVQGVGFEPT
jgi:hypothetical protein